jgi:uncharacterized membrane protein
MDIEDEIVDKIAEDTSDIAGPMGGGYLIMVVIGTVVLIAILAFVLIFR